MDKQVQQHPVTRLIWDHIILKVGVQPKVLGDKMSFPFEDQIVEITVTAAPKPKS